MSYHNPYMYLKLLIYIKEDPTSVKLFLLLDVYYIFLFIFFYMGQFSQVQME